jgi:hypothetical protein
VRAKKLDVQINEVLCKILVHNLVVLVHEMYELGITPEFGHQSGPADLLGKIDGCPEKEGR